MRLAKFQAIFELDLTPRAGSGRSKYILNLRIIGSCFDFFTFAKNRHEFSSFSCAKVLAFALVFSLNLSTARAEKVCDCVTTGHESECCWELTPLYDENNNPVYVPDTIM